MMHPSSSPFLLPSPHNYFSLEDGMIFDELLQQELHLFSENNIHSTSIAVHGQFTSVQSAMAKCSNSTNGDDGSKKKRASRKDRHRKIDTAQGPRDRRMRLSVDVGKKFFKLQDMLGFDKASKTVEWLMMKSKSKIQELISHAKPRFSGGSMVESSTSRCELLCEDIEDNINAKSSSSSNRKGKKKMRREVRKISSKETREMARKRARERTLEKSSKLQAYVNGGDHDQTSMFRSCLDQTTEQDANHLASWIINEPEPLSWNPCFDLFDYQRTGVSLDQEHQFSDFEMPGSLWEVNN